MLSAVDHGLEVQFQGIVRPLKWVPSTVEEGRIKKCLSFFLSAKVSPPMVAQLFSAVEQAQLPAISYYAFFLSELLVRQHPGPLGRQDIEQLSRVFASLALPESKEFYQQLPSPPSVSISRKYNELFLRQQSHDSRFNPQPAAPEVDPKLQFLEYLLQADAEQRFNVSRAWPDGVIIELNAIFSDLCRSGKLTKKNVEDIIQYYQSFRGTDNGVSFDFSTLKSICSESIASLRIYINVRHARPLFPLLNTFILNSRPQSDKELTQQAEEGQGLIESRSRESISASSAACFPTPLFFFDIQPQNGNYVSFDDAVYVGKYLAFLKAQNLIADYQIVYSETNRLSVKVSFKDARYFCEGYSNDWWPKTQKASGSLTTPTRYQLMLEDLIKKGQELQQKNDVERRRIGATASRSLSTPLLSGKSKSKPFWRNWKFWLGVGVAVTAVAAVALTIVTGGAALVLGALALGGLTAAVFTTVVATAAAKAAAASATAASSVALAPLASTTTSPVISSVAPAATSSLVPDAVLAATGLAAVVPPLAAAATTVTFFKMNKGKAEAELPEQKNFPIRP